MNSKGVHLYRFYVRIHFRRLLLTQRSLNVCDIDFLINHQDIRQCRFPGDQNRAEDRCEEEACSRDEEGQYFNRLVSTK